MSLISSKNIILFRGIDNTLDLMYKKATIM